MGSRSLFEKILSIVIASGFYKLAIKSERVLIPDIFPDQSLRPPGKFEVYDKRMINGYFHR